MKTMNEKVIVSLDTKSKNEKATTINIKAIAYWITTTLASLIIAASGIMAITEQPFLIEIMNHLEFPVYIMRINGSAYVLAAIAIIVPRFLWIKEWAYAGVTLIMIVATIIHLIMGDTFPETFGAILVLALTIISNILRPERYRLIHPE